MSGLLDDIEDDGWRDWARRLPEPRHPQPDTVATYLWSLQQALENRPGPIETLSRDARRTLLDSLTLYYNIIAYELEREALAAQASSALGTGSDVAVMLGVVWVEAKAASVALKKAHSLTRRERDKRLMALQVQARNVRVLLLLLRKSLIA